MTFFVLAIIPLAETCEPDWEGFDPSRHELEQDQVSSETIAKLLWYLKFLTLTSIQESVNLENMT